MELGRAALSTMIQSIPGDFALYKIVDGKLKTLYAPQELPAFCGMTPEAYEALVKDDAADLVTGGTRETINLMIEDIAAGQKDFDFIFHIHHPKRGTINIHARGRVVGQMDGCPVLLAVFVDHSIKMERNWQMYVAATELADLCVWEYDLETKRLVMSDNMATRRLRQEYDFPKVMENVPESEADTIDEKDYPAYCEMYRQLAEGALTASCDYWYKIKPGQKPRCERIVYTTVSDGVGKRRYAYGIGQDITARKLEERNYSFLYRQLSEAMTQAIGASHLDLTHNRCLDVKSLDPVLLQRRQSDTVDGYFESVAADIVDEDIRAAFLKRVDRERMIRDFREGHRQFIVEYPMLFLNGDEHWVRSTLTMLQNPDTACIELTAFALDITGERLLNRIEALLLEKEYECVGLINLKKETLTIYTCAEEDNLFKVGESCPLNEGTDLAADHFVAPEYRKLFLKNVEPSHLRDMLEEQESYFFTGYKHGGDGRMRLKKFTFYYLDEKQDIILATTEDVTRVLEEDALTGEHTRAGFIQRAAGIIDKSGDDDHYAILFFNIKGFKAINELFGAEGGDRVLRQSAAILKGSSLRPLLVGRVEADHFVCLIRQENLDYDELTRMCHRTYAENGKRFSFYWRCGIYLVHDKTASISGMCDRAKLAKEQIRDEFVKPYAIFDESMRETFVARKELTSEMQQALENREFKVYYQPIFDAQTGKIASAEALVRWEHPHRGIISPGIFIPAFEENGYISQLDLFMERSVKAFQEERIARGCFAVPVSVNLSRMDFYDNRVMTAIMEDVEQSPLPKGFTRFDVTESAFASLSEDSGGLLDCMGRLGAAILIDDFGSGYASYGTMLEFSFDIIKLDMGFVQKIGQNPKSEKIIHSMIDMAHYLDAQVIAEGVETREQLDFLLAQGCDYIQGFYFSRPLPQDEFEKLLDQPM